MEITKEKVALIDYTLKNSDNEIIDSSNGKEPLAYLHGFGGLIPGLETELEGKKSGDSFNVSIKPEDAYGLKDDKHIQTMKKEMFQGVDKIEVGMQFQAQSPEGQARMITIVEIDGDDVKADGNHPLAGETLHFEVTVKEVRDASEEELSHGHVHGAGGHQH